jgi:hypothetical protein
MGLMGAYADGDETPSPGGITEPNSRKIAFGAGATPKAFAKCVGNSSIPTHGVGMSAESAISRGYGHAQRCLSIDIPLSAVLLLAEVRSSKLTTSSDLV